MANTKHVTVRLHEDVVAEIDRYSRKVKRSRSYLIEACLQEIYGTQSADVDGSASIGNQRSRNGAAMPVVQSATSPKEQLHPVQPMRDKLAGVGDASPKLPQPQPSGSQVKPERSTTDKCPHGKLSVTYCQLTGGGC